MLIGIKKVGSIFGSNRKNDFARSYEDNAQIEPVGEIQN